MIISVSRRTDIPAHFSDWFYMRLHEGTVCVRNPMRYSQVKTIALRPEAVDAFVFWTKNPAPFMGRIRELRPYTYYFQYTLTPYGPEIEPGVPDRESSLETFRRLAETVGPRRVVWRYDPILLNARYTESFHRETFAQYAERLAPYTNRVVISFMDGHYKNVKANERELAPHDITGEIMTGLARSLAAAARANGLEINACAEPADLSPYGIKPAACIDGALLDTLKGNPLPDGGTGRYNKDRNQRPGCGCVSSVDIGMYNTCPSGCRYCYANYNAAKVKTNIAQHDVFSPLLAGDLCAPEPGGMKPPS